MSLRMKVATAGCLFIFAFFLAMAKPLNESNTLPAHILEEIHSYKDVAAQIIDFYLNGKGRGQVYNRLALFVDTFGNRLAGTKNLENAIDHMLEVLKADGLDNVHGEEAQVPHWVRGSESAALIEPRYQEFGLLGLGYSVGTPSEGITAEVLVVSSFDELHNRSAEAKGKIVVFNQDWEGYPTSVAYRAYGARETAKVGGLAVLIRSVTPFSIHSPHTGMQDYEDGIKKIPTACITVEDAEMLHRMASRGTRLVVQLKMDAQNLDPVTSRNTVAEIKGSDNPEQVVLVSGHLDSWDVGQGAMDDGGGAFISWQALSTVRQLGLKPRRTMRVVLWTAEEFGGVGSANYYKEHKSEASNMNIVMESDIGTFQPTGLRFSGNARAKAIITEVMKFMAVFNASTVFDGADGTDIDPWLQAGVPGGSLENQNDQYFYFHHSNGDTMTVQNSDQMDRCAALWTVVSYILADLEEMLPR